MFYDTKSAFFKKKKKPRYKKKKKTSNRGVFRYSEHQASFLVSANPDICRLGVRLGQHFSRPAVSLPTSPRGSVLSLCGLSYKHVLAVVTFPS